MIFSILALKAPFKEDPVIILFPALSSIWNESGKFLVQSP